METPAAVGEQLSNSLRREPAQVQGVVALPELDLLWHYACVVSSRSHDAFIPRLLRIPADFPPISPAAHSTSWSDHDACPSPAASTPCTSSSPISPRVHQAFPPSSYSASTPLYEASSRNVKIHRKHDALHRVFSAFDENGDGKVDILEISRMLEKLGIESCNQSLLANITTTSEDHMDEEEFLSLFESISCLDMNASSSSLQTDVDKDLLAAFDVFDKDGNGFISPTELQSVLCSLGFYQGHQLEACADMIAKVDENGDGFVDFFEFKKLFHVENPFLMIPCSA